MVQLALISYKAIDAICGVFLGLGAIVTASRFYARRKQKAGLKIDDWLIIPAYAFYVGTCTAILVGTKHKAIGWPAPTNEYDLVHGRKFEILVLYSMDILSTLSYGCVKASALFFYYRIFCPRGIYSAFGKVITAGVVIVVLWTICFCILLPLQCGTRFSMNWSFLPIAQTKYCSGSSNDFEGWVVSDVILDGLIILLPIPSILKLKTTRRRKIGIMAIFFLAFVGLAASIARMAIALEVFQAVRQGKKVPAGANIESQLTFYTILSGGMTFIAVNLPSMWLFFSKSSRVPEKVLNSIRSLASLRSETSHNFSGAKRSRGSEDKESLGSKIHPEAGGYEAYAMGNVESGGETPPLPMQGPGKIVVKDTVTQSSRQQ